jgi:glycosyltransferase involved in cell wall biosynthesis
LTNPNKKILIIYEFFYPAYKAGGVVQSLRNLVTLLHKDYNFYCITGGYDLNETEPLAGINLNAWNNITIDNQAKINIWYDDKKNLTPSKMNGLIHSVNPDIIYINGFMHIAFLMNPLLAIRFTSNKTIKTIIAPRGMLQEGAVAVKSVKKKWYLKVIQLLNLTKNIHWHITAPIEIAGIRKYFTATDNQITCIGNIPRNPVDTIQQTSKREGFLSLLYASIITEKKNLLYVLQSLMHCTASIEFTIYGVIKEQAYWDDCNAIIKQLPEHILVSYKGDYSPDQMQTIVSNADAMIILSKGENFSHAIFECLGAGRPIISSDFTSWNDLTSQNAGWNLPLDQPLAIAAQLDQLASISNTDWISYCYGAYQLAEAYLRKHNFRNEYLAMLDSSMNSA